MRSCILGAVIAACTTLAIPQTTNGQMWSDSQKEVWGVVTGSWDAIIAKNVGWSDTYVHPNALVWGDENPMPRTRDLVKRWDRYTFANSTTKVSQFSPAGIVVEGSTAVAHYYYSLGTETTEGKTRTVHGRCTDVLLRSEGTWKFIAWNCGDEPSDDD